jgi:hydroxymethylbilane synthase
MSGGTTIRVGSRESALAVRQTELFLEVMSRVSGAPDFSLHTFKTTGDKIQTMSLRGIGGKGLFVKELDEALLEGRIDIAVHSLKDVPVTLSSGIKIACFSRREDPRDALVLSKKLAAGADLSVPVFLRDKNVLRVGCSSKRRCLQLARLCPAWQTVPVRGNVPRRLEKLDGGEFDALILAASGLKRLGLASRISYYFEIDDMLPAAGQGILAATVLEDSCLDFLAEASDKDSEACACAERAFIREMGGDCSSPIAAYARMQTAQLELRARYYSPEFNTVRDASLRGTPEEAEALGKELAVKMRTES